MNLKLAVLVLICMGQFTFLFAQKTWKTERMDSLASKEFIPEKSIHGNLMLVLSDSFDQYKDHINIKDRNGKVVVRITTSDTGIICSYFDTVYSNSDSKNPFQPWELSLNPDYFRLTLECIREEKEGYVVRLNDESLGFILKTDKTFKAVRLSEFIFISTNLGLNFDRSANPIRVKPKRKAEIIKQSFPEKYTHWYAESIEVKGDWIKIRSIDNETGWIQWRNKEKLLIRFDPPC